MKTFSSLAVLVAMTILPQTGAAQASQTRIAKVKKAATFIGKRLGDRASKAILKSAAADSKKLPGTTKLYQYNNGDWTYYMTTNSTFDQYGNVSTAKTWSDENGMMQITTNKYDNVETSFLVSQTQSTYDSPTATTPTYEFMNRRVDVTRNEKGQVTKVEDWEANDTYTGLDLETAVSLEYGSDDKINKIIISSYDDNEEMKVTLNDVVWKEYNGKILSTIGTDLENIIADPQNLIESASAEMSAEGIDVKGNLTSDYSTEGKRELTLSMNYYGMPVASYKFYYEQTDDNGSFINRSTISFMGEADEIESITVKYNDKKDMVEETISEGKSIASLKTSSSTQYDYTYNEETGLADYMILKNLDLDTNTYNPNSKYVYSDYQDVASGISNAAANVNTGKTAVYNTQGMYVGNSTDKLSDGLYIIKQDGKTFKIMK